MKQKIKGKNCAVFYFTGKIALSFTSPDFFLNFFCYEVIVKQKIYKRSTNHYSEWGAGGVDTREGEREREKFIANE
jgi:hypothetical protein